MIERRFLLLVAIAVCLLASVGGFSPAAASSERTIAFAANWPQEIYTIRPDGTGLKRITHDPFFNVSPSWAPGGRYLAYNCNRNNVANNGGICTIRRDGTHRRKLLPRNGPYHSPAWSPKGNLIALCRNFRNSEFESQIYTMHRDGSHLRRLTDLPQIGAEGPAWSPDGTKIVFFGETPGVVAGWSLWIMRKDGSHLREMAKVSASYSDPGKPSWSPDGRKIAFGKIPAKSEHDVLFTIHSDGTHLRRLKKGRRARGSSPSWSPKWRENHLSRFHSACLLHRPNRCQWEAPKAHLFRRQLGV